MEGGDLAAVEPSRDPQANHHGMGSESRKRLQSASTNSSILPEHALSLIYNIVVSAPVMFLKKTTNYLW